MYIKFEIQSASTAAGEAAAQTHTAGVDKAGFATRPPARAIWLFSPVAGKSTAPGTCNTITIGASRTKEISWQG